LFNFVAHGYYSAIVVITTSTIKVAQRWCHKTFLSYTWKSHSNEKGPFIAEQLDWKEASFYSLHLNVAWLLFLTSVEIHTGVIDLENLNEN
jgi:hypothetical protein